MYNGLIYNKKLTIANSIITQQNFGIKITSVLESEELVNSLKWESVSNKSNIVEIKK